MGSAKHGSHQCCKEAEREGLGVHKKVVIRTVLHVVQNGSAATTNASEQPKMEEKLENMDAIATRRGGSRHIP
jgi:hypothetical protein